ncbi:hypothetical protein ABTQ33_11270 [Paucilactobacillus suebicus]|uniref:Uncharacterized protein n=1 Tax=Paucilactobacillus suebicus DSM 5007 = KCTC 3549 TaxID=1423807 RepID=A0A0R1W318_9LACO|nr:hypothetical protein [Paucilactobacillus suebicus]KRM10507.1 hypothetical protein FD16_GL001210 [Paucilactobacillus suebicus DSM 5007 = KCTC 3549]
MKQYDELVTAVKNYVGETRLNSFDPENVEKTRDFYQMINAAFRYAHATSHQQQTDFADVLRLNQDARYDFVAETMDTINSGMMILKQHQDRE